MLLQINKTFLKNRIALVEIRIRLFSYYNTIKLIKTDKNGIKILQQKIIYVCRARFDLS